MLVFLHQLGYGSRWERDVFCRFRGMSFADLEGIVLVFLHQLGYGSRWERDINPAQDHPADGCDKFFGYGSLINSKTERAECRGSVLEYNQPAGSDIKITSASIATTNTCTQTADIDATSIVAV